MSPEQEKAAQARAKLAAANDALVQVATRGEDTTAALAAVRAAAEEAARTDAAWREAEHARSVITWSPPNALHVSGTWAPRTFDSYGLPIPQRVECRCNECGQTWGTLCGSGLVRAHVQRFALGHLHREPIGARVEQPPETRRA